MGRLPQYKLSEDKLPELVLALEQDNLLMTCTHPLFLENNSVTMYQGWEIKRGDLVVVLMWATYSIHRHQADTNLQITVGTPRWRGGRPALVIVERILCTLGGVKLA
jgi:hypothetical protein